MPNLFKPDLIDSKPIEEAPSEDPKNENTDNTENKTEEKPDTPLQKEYAEIQKWDEMNLAPEILRGIYAYGYEIPSPIQKKAIQPMIDGRDLIAQAQSGTGKTATFTIGSLMCIDKSNQNVQVICLSPTRELSTQIYTVFKGLSEFMPDLVVETFIGGVPVNENIQTIKRTRPHIAIGTPGRVFDLIRRKAINCRHVKKLILDEADELLSYGFDEQIKSIFTCLPENIQTCIFSATLPNHIFDMTDRFMKNPVSIIVKAEQLTLEGISQYYIATENDVQKYATLVDLYSRFSVSHCIIYTNTINRVTDLSEAMTSDGYPVCCIHSNMSISERETALADFRSGKHRVLISSNLTARGIDVQQVSCVINFDIPRDVSTYLHRIGRSGRWGRKGVGINLITERDVSKMKEIETYYRTQIDEMPSDIAI
jgi:translation initiation factor 4A